MVKINSSTLVEVIVAMVVLAIAFSIGIMIYFNIISGSGSYRAFETNLILKQVASETIRNKSYIDESLEINDLTIHKAVSAYNGSKKVMVLELRAVDQNQKEHAVQKQLILIE